MTVRARAIAVSGDRFRKGNELMKGVTWCGGRDEERRRNKQSIFQQPFLHGVQTNRWATLLNWQVVCRAQLPWRSIGKGNQLQVSTTIWRHN